MIKTYLKIALRNLIRNRSYSFINIGGLAIGMTVALLIGLWVYDELTFSQYHKNYNRIAKVKRRTTWDGQKGVSDYQVMGLGMTLRESYERDFEYAVMATEGTEHVISIGDKAFNETGIFIQPEGPQMFTLKMLYGSIDGLKSMNSILISESFAKNLFGSDDPMGKSLRLNDSDVTITGVYENLPKNSEFTKTMFIAPFDLFVSSRRLSTDDWRSFNNVLIYVQVRPYIDFLRTSATIRDLMLPHIDKTSDTSQPELFLHPMSKWHLHSKFENGIITTSERLKFVWFYGTIGSFVLLLACVNFTNLTTAHSQRRAKEVGIRKAIGSLRHQLIYQFLCESLLMAVLAFTLSIVSVQFSLPLFNEVADKETSLPVTSPMFWLTGIAFTSMTALLAGSYPAIYLSSLQPIRVLKGIGKGSSVFFHKSLVIFQFTISVGLIISTIIVFQQIQYAKNRSVGYSREGLITLHNSARELEGKYDLLRNELKKTGVVANVAQSNRSITSTYGSNNGFDWQGREPSFDPFLATVRVSAEFGNTVGWQFVEGRDFSSAIASDSLSVVINEEAVNVMGLENPIGQTISWNPGNSATKNYIIIGVVKNVLRGSPFEAAQPSVFFMEDRWLWWLYLKLNTHISTSQALSKIEGVLHKIIPTVPFDYKFVDETYAAKFSSEERIGKLAGFFTIIAVLISCLGLFGLASFVAEQRTKEIGIRKVLGASVANLWQMLSKDFVVLVIISSAISIPISSYFMTSWLQNYEYRTEISVWIFITASMSALLITLLTVSFQTLKAAITNPVESLRSE